VLLTVKLALLSATLIIYCSNKRRSPY